MPDQVNSPAHYTDGMPEGVEVIDIIRAQLSPEEFRGYLNGNVLKYTLRWKRKGGAEDLRKSMKYAEWLVETLTPNQPRA